MLDYRARFYARYRTATRGSDTPAGLDLSGQFRQYRGRWAKWLPADVNSSFLDIACGAGEFLSYLESRGYTNAAGVDISEEQVDAARLAGVKNVVCDDAVAFLRAKTESYDVISAFNIFEHLAKAEVMQLLDAIHRALRKGGMLLAVTPNGISPFSGSTRYWDFSHELSYTPASWRQLARLSGFASAEFEEYGPMPYSIAGMIRVALWSTCRLCL